MGTVSLANHAHVFPESVNPAGTVGRLLGLMDACEIGRAVCFAPFAKQCEGKGVEPNRWLAGEVEKNDRLYGFGTVDVRREDVREQVGEIAGLGLRGIKVHPNGQGLPILSKKAFELYGAAQERGLFLTFHSGVHQSPIKDTRVLDFDQVAWEFPELRFSLEHVGGYHFFHEALAVIFNHMPTPWNPKEGRVFAGLTSIFTQDHLRFWYQSRERLLELVAQVGAGQMIFGLDFPYNLEGHTRVGIEAIRGLGLSAEEEGMILGGTMRRVLGV
jgi:predicted TIM-barrel fold metal-dependent hydrolase